MRPTWIDLGEDRSAEPAPSRRRRGRHRPWWALAVAAACLSLTAAVPPRPGLVPVLRLPYGPGESFTIAPGTFLVLSGNAVTAYGLPSGERRWRTQVPSTVDGLAYLDGTGAVEASGRSEEPVTLGLDYRTGRILWPPEDGFLAGLVPLRNLAVLAPSSVSGEMHAIDLRTGRTTWRRELPRGTNMIPSWPDRAHPYYGVQEPDGTVDVIDETTGAAVVQIRLPPGSPTEPPAVSLVGGQLLTAMGDATGTTLVAYDLPGGTVRWRVRLTSNQQFASPCGPLLCLGDDTGLVALDPATGAVRWRTSQWQGVDQLPGGLVLLSSFENGQYRAMQVAQPGTLRPVLDLTGWVPVTDPTAPPPLLLARDATNRTWFATVDPAARGVHPLGALPDVVLAACWAALRYLVCPTVHKELRLWRYNP